MPITQEQLDQVKASHAGAELHVVENPLTDDVIVCKSPGVEWTRFRAESEGKPFTARLAAMKTLIMCCAVYPPKDDLERMLIERPGLVETFTGELGEIAGTTAKATHRKL